MKAFALSTMGRLRGGALVKPKATGPAKKVKYGGDVSLDERLAQRPHSG